MVEKGLVALINAVEKSGKYMKYDFFLGHKVFFRTFFMKSLLKTLNKTLLPNVMHKSLLLVVCLDSYKK